MFHAEFAEQSSRELGLLGLVHLRADDASAPDIEKQVKVEEAAADSRATQVSDVPAEHPQRFARDVLAWLIVALRRPAALPVLIELSFGENAPQRALRADVSPRAGKLRYGLFRAQIPIRRLIDEAHCLVLFGFAELMRRQFFRASSRIGSVGRSLPTLHGARGNTQDSTRSLEASAAT